MAKARKLPGDLYKRLHQAMLQAFPNRPDFEIFLRFELEVVLATIASAADEMSTVHFKVLEWFQARERLGELVQKASAERPHNKELADIYAEILQLSTLPEKSEIVKPKKDGEVKPKPFWQQVPGWVYGLVGVAFLALLVWSGARLARGGNGNGMAEVTPTDDESLTVVVAEDTETPTPTLRPSDTLTNQPGQTPTPSRPSPTMTPSPTPTPNPNKLPAIAELGDIWLRPADGMEMVFVPAGSFMMGSEDVNTGETPIHEVTLDAFWIDKTEVTNVQYNLCVADGVCTESEYADNSTLNGEDYPVVGISWFDADDYCEWASGRLLTEAEWEYAARGPNGNRYPWGDEQPTCSLAQFGDCDGATVPVGSFPAGASWVRALDMTGNVGEWVNDWYDSDYYAGSPESNPEGPNSGEFKVYRGGSWGYVNIPTSRRGGNVPTQTSNIIGFRCAQEGSP